MEEKTAMSLSEDMRFPSPQHPLPEEISRLDKADTVCQYCGVSYLILHEIKQLKMELMSAKNEISDLKAYRDMYAELQQKWLSHVSLTELNNSVVKEKDAQIAALEQQNKTLKKDNCRVSELAQTFEISKKKIELLSSCYTDVFQKLRAFKTNLQSLKSMVLSNRTLSTTALSTISNNIEQEIQKAYDTSEKRWQNELIRQKRELIDKMHEREAEWKILEIKLREADALSVQEVTKAKAQLLNISEEKQTKSNEVARLERENSDFRRQIEALKNSILTLEKALASEQQRYIDMRNIVDQRSQGNQMLDNCVKQQQLELESCRHALAELENRSKREREELAEQFSQQLKTIQSQMQIDIETIQSDQKKQFEANQERIKQTIRRESEARITAIQEGFSNERNRFEAKFSRLTTELEACQRANDDMVQSRTLTENRALELESKVKRLEGLLRQVHDEKLEESTRASRAENENSLLQELIQNHIIERNNITEALNNIKHEIIKAKLPQEVFEELMRQVPDSGTNSHSTDIEGADRQNKEHNLRARAWSFNSQNSSNNKNTFPGVNGVNGDVQKQLSADGATRGRNVENIGALKPKKMSHGDIPSQLSPATFANIAEKRKVLIAQQMHGNAAFTLPPLGPSSTVAKSNSVDNMGITSVTSSPLGLYQRNNSNSTASDIRLTPAAPQPLNPVSSHRAPVRQSDSNFDSHQRPPLGKSGAYDMRLKLAAILSRNK